MRSFTVLFAAALTIAPAHVFEVRLELASDTLSGRLRFLDSGLRVLGGFRFKIAELLQAFLIMSDSLLHEIGLRIHEALRQFQILIETVAPKLDPCLIDGQCIVTGRIRDPGCVFGGPPAGPPSEHCHSATSS